MIATAGSGNTYLVDAQKRGKFFSYVKILRIYLINDFPVYHTVMLILVMLILHSHPAVYYMSSIYLRTESLYL